MFDLSPSTKALHLPAEVRFQLYYVENTGCWEWLGAKTLSGYGQFWVRSGEKGHRRALHIPAHRYQYEMLIGPIPDGMQLDHLCRNPACVNPSHLEIVTSQENTLRGEGPAAVNARKAHCLRGHLFDEINTWYEKTGSRHCRTCHKEHERQRYAKLKPVAISH